MCRRVSRVKVKKKQAANQNFFKAYKPIASEMVKIRRLISRTKLVKSNFPFVYISKIIFSWKWLYLSYQLSNYHPEKVLDMDLMCPIVIQNQTKVWT